MKRGLLIGLGVAVLVAVIGGGWLYFVRDDAPEELSLEDAISDIVGTTQAPSGDSGTVAPTTTGAPSTTTADSASLDGDWNIDTEFTEVGYRIGEELSGIGTFEAVGRTSEVAGSLTLNGSVIEAVAIEVDMGSLRSDNGTRDGALRTRGLETDTFPTATFVLTEPLELGSVPASGATVSAVATGELTLHGVTQPVQIPLDGTLADGRIVVVGQLEIALADYDIEKPTGFRVLSIEDNGIFEVQLTFSR
ncbi:MAG: YceI family protein [Acidimicrobiia bacterium]|nr:YceI family protein [Acidimicrobiia bacterium]